MQKLPLCFTSGCIGGAAYGLTVWACGYYGLAHSLGVSIAPTLSPHWLYPLIVWGGIWGLAFLLPILRSNLFVKALVLSLLPSLVQLLVIYPFKTRYGIAGLGLGSLTPVLVLLFNASWAIVTATAIKLLR